MMDQTFIRHILLFSRKTFTRAIVTPVVQGMKFEEEAKARLETISYGLKRLMPMLEDPKIEVTEDLFQDIAGRIGHFREKKQYYEIVLKCELDEEEPEDIWDSLGV